LSRLRLAKREDGLQSARQIREPVNNHHDIVAAFDGITYAKGGAVLSMLEHYLGEERFRAAVRDHMRRFAWGSADVNDFIASLVRASEPAIEPAFKSFLFQNGLPKVRVESACANGSMTLSQSRFVPLGTASGAAQTWQFPVCARYAHDGEIRSQCEWLRAPGATFAFDGGSCPDWMMLDASYAGYYHWAMDSDAYLALSERGAKLSEIEWESVADSLDAGLVDGSLDVATVWPAVAPLAQLPYPTVSLAPARLLEHWLSSYGDEPKLAAMLRLRALDLYAAKDAARAFDPQFVRGLTRDEDRVFFGELARFMALFARDSATRDVALATIAEALTDDGLDTRKLDPLALETALTVAVQDGDDSVRERILSAFLASRDGQFRAVALSALGRAPHEKFAASLRQLALAGSVRTNEIERLLSAQFKEAPTRPGAWRFVRDHYDELLEVMPPRHAARLPARAAQLCDEAMSERLRALFEPRADSVAGGKRALDKALEALSHCAARAAHERAQVRQFFVPGNRR
jgi:alanyl aminopeptidase